MKQRQRTFFALILLVAGIIACNKNSDSSIPVTSSNINVFLAVPGVQFDVVIDTTSIGNNIGYGESTGYHAFEAKRYDLNIYPTGNRTTPVAGGQVSLRNGHYYSVFLSVNHNNALQLQLAEDGLTGATAQFGRVRFVNLSDTYVSSSTSTTALTLDFYINGTRLARRQSYRAVSQFFEIPAGTNTRDVRYADSSLSFLYANSPNFTVENQKSYSIIAYGNAQVADSFKLVEFVHTK
jgi:hypothetical protein